MAPPTGSGTGGGRGRRSSQGFSFGGGGGGGGSPIALGGRLTPVVVWIAGIELGVFLMFAFGAPRSLEAHLVVIPERFIGHRELWMPLTGLLCHTDGLSLAFNLLTLWLFVPALEQWWGSRRFAAFFFGLGALGLAIYGVSAWLIDPFGPFGSTPLGGLTSAILATVVAFGALFPNAAVSFFGVLPLKSKHLAWGIAVFALGTEALQRAWPNAVADSVTMLAALALTWPRLRGLFSVERLRERRRRRRYRVLPGGRQNDEHWMN